MSEGKMGNGRSKILAHGHLPIDSSNNYHSQSSTKMSEKLGGGKRQLIPIKNNLAHYQNSYGLSDINERAPDHESSKSDLFTQNPHLRNFN